MKSIELCLLRNHKIKVKGSHLLYSLIINIISMKYLLFLSLILLLQATEAEELDYTDFVNDLGQKIKQAPFKQAAYDRLAYITDTYGPRMWGSMVLEQVIYEMASMASKAGF